MSNIYQISDPQVYAGLQKGQVAIVPTDTVYGLVASARDQEAVQRVYDLKGRSDHKPCIVLVDSTQAIATFGVAEEQIERVKRYWPGPLSVVFDGDLRPEYSYLRRALGWPPFRIPASAPLRALLARSGPLIAPSANLQGEPTVSNIVEARQVFGDQVDLYVDGGALHGEPSTLVRLQPDGELNVIRQGALRL